MAGYRRSCETIPVPPGQKVCSLISLIIIIGNVFVAAASIPVAVFFYCFELVLVANLQAFIFALLSGIYIGTAAEPHH
jgi:F-type H+-transporting ATPase subunit a